MPVEADFFYTRCECAVSSPRLPPLVLIHGAGGTHLHWPPEIRRMKLATVYALDLPGHGQSKGLAAGSILQYAQCLSAWMDALQLGRVIPVGHSMGGAIAQIMALEMPERVAGLVLVGTGGRLRVHPRLLELTADSKGYPQAVDMIAQWAFSEHADARLLESARARYADARPETIHADFMACDHFDVMERLSDISVPVLVVCGEKDRLTPPKYSQHLTQQIPKATLAIVQDAGHMVMLEKPAEVAAHLKQFLDPNSF